MFFINTVSIFTPIKALITVFLCEERVKLCPFLWFFFVVVVFVTFSHIDHFICK